MQVCNTSSAVTPDLVTHFLFLLIGAEQLHLLTNQSPWLRQTRTLLLEQLLEGQCQRVHREQEHEQTRRGQRVSQW